MSDRFPTDAPRARVIAALKMLGFRVVREGNHVSLLREADDGTSTPLTLPGHAVIKGSTLRTACTQARISRRDFLEAYRRSR